MEPETLPAPVPVFPGEILRHIALQIPENDLYMLSTVNRLFREVYLAVDHRSFILLGPASHIEQRSDQAQIYYARNRARRLRAEPAADKAKRVKEITIDIKFLMKDYENERATRVNDVLDSLSSFSVAERLDLCSHTYNTRDRAEPPPGLLLNVWSKLPHLTTLTMSMQWTTMAPFLTQKQGLKLRVLRLVIDPSHVFIGGAPEDTASFQLNAALPFVNNLAESLEALELVIHDTNLYLSSFFEGLEYFPYLRELSLFLRYDCPGICNPSALNSFLGKHARQIKDLCIRFFGDNSPSGSEMAAQSWFKRCFNKCNFTTVRDLAIGLNIPQSLYGLVLAPIVKSTSSLSSLTILDVYLSLDSLGAVLSSFSGNKVKEISFQTWWMDKAIAASLLKHCPNVQKVTLAVHCQGKDKFNNLFGDDDESRAFSFGNALGRGGMEITQSWHNGTFKRSFPRFQWGTEDACMGFDKAYLALLGRESEYEVYERPYCDKMRCEKPLVRYEVRRNKGS